MSPALSPAKLLVVDDNPGDARLVQEALKSEGLANDVRIANDGETALEILSGADGWRADLVLLDLRLPRMGGHEVLTRIRAQPSTRLLPVVVMSSSDREDDVRRAYESHPNAYIRKPLEYDDFKSVIAQLESFWLAVVTLPLSGTKT